MCNSQLYLSVTHRLTRLKIAAMTSSMPPDPEPDAVMYKTTFSGITTVTLNRAASRNAVNPATAQMLYNAFQKFESDESKRLAYSTAKWHLLHWCRLARPLNFWPEDSGTSGL